MEHEDRFQSAPKAKYEGLLFDVDDTLYPLGSGLSKECTKNITEYMIKYLGIEETNVPELCVQLYKEYGTTMAGLRAIGYDFDYDHYHSYVHGRLPYEKLKPDPVLRSVLHTLPLRKVIFSNANESHVAKVLGRLGLEDCFEDVICFETLNPTHETKTANNEDDHTSLKTPIVCKPFPEAFEQAFKMAGIDPQKTIFFDDSIRNLQTAKRLGLHTVWVGSSHRTEGVDYSLESIHNIREALPELCEAIEQPEEARLSETALETIVRA